MSDAALDEFWQLIRRQALKTSLVEDTRGFTARRLELRGTGLRFLRLVFVAKN